MFAHDYDPEAKEKEVHIMIVLSSDTQSGTYGKNNNPLCQCTKQVVLLDVHPTSEREAIV